MADQHTTALARIAHHNAQRAERAELRHARKEERDARFVKKVARTGEVFAGAAIAGVVQGRFGDTKIGGLVPLDLLIGFGLNGVALSGQAGDYADPKNVGFHLANLGDGFIAGYGAEAGFAVGQRWKNTGHLFSKGVPSMPLPPAPPPPAPGQPAVHGEIDPRIVAAQIIQGT